MKKMKLSLDDLKVESFETTPESKDDSQGTVFAYFTPGLGNTCDPGCTNATCGPTCATCDSTCVNTCGNTCGSTCEGTCASNTCGNTCLATCPNTCANTCSACGSGLTCDCGTFACFYCTRQGC